MVKKMLVILSAAALVISVVGVACAFNPCMGGLATTGDSIMIPMKVKTTFTKRVSGTAGGDSTLFADGCEQYTGGFRPWLGWRGTVCAMKIQVIPPKCVAPGYGGPMAWSAPPAVSPGAKLVSNLEKCEVTSPGCDPCVTGGLKYEMVKKQVVK